MPKRKSFKCRALSSTSTRTYLEGRRSVELMKLSLKPFRASRAPAFQGHYGGSQLVLTLYRMHFFCFQMCRANRLPEMMKNGDAGIFHVYYSLKGAVYTVWIFIYSSCDGHTYKQALHTYHCSYIYMHNIQ